VGLSLAAGQSVAQAVAALGHVAEGVYSARTVVLRAAQLGVAMPIAQAVVAVLKGHWSPRQALTELMSREPTVELT
jgi:glycerol-3-phosphate dehydrogenase (NAD(P)+)